MEALESTFTIDGLPPELQDIADSLCTDVIIPQYSRRHERAIGHYMDWREFVSSGLRIDVFVSRKFHIPPLQAVVDLAELLDVPRQNGIARLRNFIGNRPSFVSQLHECRPSWDAATGQLKYRGVVVRTIRTQGVCCKAILDWFERSGWRDVIDSPFSNQKRGRINAKNAVAQLNKGLVGFKFFVILGSKQILWR